MMRTPMGYKQKRNRYFWKKYATTVYSVGFNSKGNCDKWIEEERQQGNFEWRAGFLLKLKDQNAPWVLVDRKGNEVKY